MDDFQLSKDIEKLQLIKQLRPLRDEFINLKYEVEKQRIILKEKEANLIAYEEMLEARKNAQEADVAQKKAYLEIELAQIRANKGTLQNEIEGLNALKSTLEENIIALRANVQQIYDEIDKHLLDIEKFKSAKNEQIEAFEMEVKKNQELKAQLLKERMQIEDEIKKAKESAASIIEKASLTCKEEEERIQNKRNLAEAEIAQYRLKATEELEKWIESQKKEYDKTRKDQIANINRKIESELAMIFERLSPAIVNEASLEDLAESLKKVPQNILIGKMSRSDGIDEKYQYNPEASRRVKNYWRRVLISISLGIILLTINYINPNLYRGIRDAVFSYFSTNESASAIYIKKMKEKRENIPKFIPMQDAIIKPTYTDSVIYTKDYKDLLLSDHFQKKWVIELNKFFVYELDITDRTIVEFIPKEKMLVLELEELKKAIKPPDIDQMINSMRELEEKFFGEFARMLGGDDNLKRFLSFRSKFYQDFIEFSKKSKN